MLIKDNKNKHLVILADGSYLKYRFIGQKGNQFTWYHSWDYYRLRQHLQNPNKRSRPALGLLNSGTDHIILAADFDQIPDHIKTEHFSEMGFWDNFLEECIQAYDGRLKVGKSYSGKVKIFCPFILPEGISAEILTPEVMQAMLRSVLFSNHHWFDQNHAGMNITFISEAVIDTLKDIGNLIPTQIVFDNREDLFSDTPYTSVISKEDIPVFSNTHNTHTGIIYVPSESPLYSDSTECNDCDINDMGGDSLADDVKGVQFFFRFEDDNLPSFFDFNSILCLRGGEEFIRILLRAKNLLNSGGYGISTNKLASQCKISVKQSSKLLSRAVELDLIVCTDSTYSYGHKCRTYKAKSELKKYLKRFFSKEKVELDNLPNKIYDHKWELTLPRVRKFFSTPEEFENWAERLDGIEKGDRRKKVQRIVTRWEEISTRTSSVD